MKKLSICLFAWIGVCSTLPAATVVSNLGNANGINSLVFSNNSSYTSHAGSFTTGLLPATLDSVRISLDSSSTFRPLTVSIWSNSGSVPGSALAALSGLTNPSAGLFDYTGSLSLSASTTYWLVLETSLGALTTIYDWDGTPDASEASSEGWTIGNGRATFSSGSGVWSANATTIPRFSVDATIAPEPGGFALAGLGVAGLMRVVRRLRKLRAEI